MARSGASARRKWVHTHRYLRPSEHDVISARSVVLIGETVREQLFADEDPIGQVSRINEQPVPGRGRASSLGQSS